MSKLIGRLLVVLAFGWAGSASAGLISYDITVTTTFNSGAPSDLSTMAVGNFMADDTVAGPVSDFELFFDGSTDDAIGGFERMAGTNNFDPDTLLLQLVSIHDDTFSSGLIIGTAAGARPADQMVAVWITPSFQYPDPYTGLELIWAGTYVVTPTVPTPATLPLLGLGLAALGYSRRKRKQHTYNNLAA